MQCNRPDHRTSTVSLQLLSLTDEELARGIVTSSTGNHALAVLYACQQVSRVR